jgi:excisionase family DNA binding protein
MGRPATPAELLTTSEAARRLGCHPETLRRRIRSGQLKAIRGSRGAYLVGVDELRQTVHPRRGRPVWLPAPLPAEQVESSWSFLRYVLWRLDAQAELEFTDALQQNPELDPASHRLITVHRLRLAGLMLAEIAAQLGISIRHASRLARTPPVPALRRRMLALLRRDVHEQKSRRQQGAETLLAGLRAQLQKQGVRPSALTRADLSQSARALPRAIRKRSRPAVVHPENRQQLQALRDAGLDDEQIEAVRVLGLTPDELNALLLRGLGPPVPGRRIAISRSEPPPA